ncbi:hypothetical protein C7974DRAFT_452112 [Boeremia exigua]|uniref:uncharacterized protein n=1 Tax=Boeremia exigua TaxID=749465 RepID=UPI001E8ED10D|nr:uncharacterized protein C7974DRAFT_452112 [Boeremia exigua]KAH6632985.1 hypothetical protein C7974DRAFT_452112 [Boeremia exigua]
MAAHFEIAEAKPVDAEAIASLFALSWVSPFTRLQFGEIDPTELATSMAPRIAEQIVRVSSKFIVARHVETGNIAAIAQWTTPVETDSKQELEEDRDERQQFEDEAYRRGLPESSNKDLVMAFTLGLRQLREDTLQGRKHYLLENLATHPDYRGKGLASQLVEWASSLADEQQVLVYLDTASDNPAGRLYKKLGFEEQGRNTISDLTNYAATDTLKRLGCGSEHTHVAFLRFPRLQVQLDRAVNDDDYGEEETTCHDPDSEPVPPLVQYTPAFAEAEALIRSLVRNIHGHILKEEQDSESTYIAERTIAVESPAYSPAYVVGISGNSGIGKSTLINAILGIISLCPTSENDAGTLVPMELVQAPDDQIRPFAAHVELFSLESCLNMIKWAVKDYFHSFVSSEADADDGQDVDRGSPALKILLAVFCGCEGFEDGDSTSETLGELQSEDDPHILGKLLNLTRDIYRQLAAYIGKGPLLAGTAEELAETIEPFIQTAASPMIDVGCDTYLESSVWPFVKLAKRITDTNRYRVRATKVYLRKCNFILVAHANTRAGDDPGFKSNVLALQKIGNAKNVKVPYTLDEQGRLKSIEDHEKLVKAEQKQLTANLKSAKKNSLSDLVDELQRKEKLYKLHLQHADSLRRQTVVAARVRQVRSELQTWFRNKTKDSSDLLVFCVSSEQYLKHVQDYALLSPPDLPLDLTGIPQLRHLILTLPGRLGKKEALVHHFTNVVPGLLNAISLSCAGFRPMMKREHLAKIIKETRLEIPSQYRRARQEFWTSSVATVLSKIELSESAWLDKAAKLIARWTKPADWKPISFYTFLRHEGAWKTPSCGRADWNQELLALANESLRPDFDALCDIGLKSFRTERLQTLSETLYDMEKDIKSNLDSNQFGAFHDFFDNLGKQRRGVEIAIKEATATLETKLRHLFHDSLTSGDTNPFTKKMSYIYGLSFHASPTKTMRTKHQIRTHTFREKVLQPKLGPYMEIKHHVEINIDSYLLKLETDLLEKCESVFEHILHDFNNVCPQRADDTPGATKRRAALGKIVEQAKGTLDGNIRMKLLECGLELD